MIARIIAFQHAVLTLHRWHELIDDKDKDNKCLGPFIMNIQKMSKFLLHVLMLLCNDKIMQNKKYMTYSQCCEKAIIYNFNFDISTDMH